MNTNANFKKDFSYVIERLREARSGVFLKVLSTVSGDLARLS